MEWLELSLRSIFQQQSSVGIWPLVWSVEMSREYCHIYRYYDRYRIWKPSELTPLISIAVFRIVQEVLAQHNLPSGELQHNVESEILFSGVVSLICGGREIGERMAAHEMIKMVSFTGKSYL